MQRIGQGLGVINTDVAGDARQHHVATDQNIQRRAMQGDMFWRMAVTADAMPIVVTDTQNLCVHQAYKLLGQTRHHVAKLQVTVCQRLKHGGFNQTVRAKKCLCLVAVTFIRRGHQSACRVVVGGADIQGHLPVIA